ncbi:hypothetical protein BA184_07620 [Helicobacter pullorum]|uniref:hypothetical protein n=2 Tax=Helicobacter pullorum TaxID=35818 RepID=UPI0008168D53|nr:hypothetical protein [Helicobacter pullorum]OCR04740.1 hypothetical protein BA729_02250 [Helicobacter pullorum]OCR08057.1 hypothetical protein BA185_01525 [Helicobacter pullorum]OCR09020.1 hypothetical protein BA184_07620 [Helicobacter pullorum]
MSKEIQEFIEKLKDWKNNFPIQEYDYTKYDCEVANIAKWQKENNINELVNFWNEKFKSYSLALKHPFYNDIITKAVYNCYDGNVVNCVFMIDEDNKHPWIFVQCFRSINLLICKNGAYCVFEDVEGYNLSILGTASRHFSKIECNHLSYRDVEFGVSLQNARPAHFFYMLLKHLIRMELCGKHILVERFCFFIPSFLHQSCTAKNENRVYIQPTIVPGSLGNAVLNEFVAKDSIEIQSCECNFGIGCDLTIWLGLPGERRAWLEQIEGTANILRHFNKYFKKIKVYVDGMTAYDGERQDFPENKVLFNKVVDATRKLFLEECDKNIIFTFEDSQDLVSSLTNEERFVVFKSLSGYDYRTKICYCNDCDIAISDSGTTALVPFQFYKKPGVVFYGELASSYINFSKSLANNAYQRAVDEKLVVQVNRKSFLVWDYHIPYQHIYNLAAEVLEELSGENKLKVKNLKMHRLEVPPVELIAKQYELEKQFEVKIPLENVEFVDKLATQLQQKDQIIQTKNQELASKTQELTQTKNQLDTIKVQLDSTQKELDSKTKELSSLPIKKQTLEIKNLEQDLINKQLHTKQLEKELGYESNVLKELELKNQELIQTKNQLDSTKKQLESKNKFLESNPNPSHLIQNTPHFKGKLAYLNTLTTAKDRIHNHLSYKLGQAMIENSKSLLGYIRMPYVLSYIKDKHKQEQKIYQEKIKKDPSLKLPTLESYPDYKESLKEKECLTYKLGEAFIKANKTWYKGGYVKLWFEVRRLKGERK